MDPHTLQRLLRLAKKTGSPVIMTDQQGSEPSVLLPLDAYEAMIDGLMYAEEVFEDGQMEAFDDFDDVVEDELDIPLQELDQDLPFLGEEQDLPEGEFTHSVMHETVVEEVPFDPPMPEPAQTTQQPPDEPGEEQFYLEPIE